MSGLPHHESFSIFLIFEPFSFIVVPTRISHFSFSWFQSLFPASFVFWSNLTYAIPWFIFEGAVTISQSIFPIPFIHDSIIRILILPISMSQSFLHSAFILAAISPVVTAFPRYLISFEFPFIHSSILPSELSFAMEYARLHFSLIYIPIIVEHLASSIHSLDHLFIRILTYTTSLHDVNYISSPVLHDQVWQFERQVSDLREEFHFLSHLNYLNIKYFTLCQTEEGRRDLNGLYQFGQY